jgi:hypothetical protein
LRVLGKNVSSLKGSSAKIGLNVFRVGQLLIEEIEGRCNEFMIKYTRNEERLKIDAAYAEK